MLDGSHAEIVMSVDYLTSISRGLIPGSSIFTSNGVLTTAGATNQAITPSGQCNIPAVAGVQMSFVSTSIQDSAAGTGIRTLLMSYLDAGLNSKSEIIALDGTTPVLSVATDVRFIQTLMVVTAGNTSGVAAGNIISSDAAVNYGQISTGSRLQESAYRMVPVGKVFIPHLILASSISTTADTTSLFKAVFRSITYFVPSNAMGVQNNSLVIPLSAGRPIPAGTIFGIEHTTNKAGTVTASMIGHLENAI